MLDASAQVCLAGKANLPGDVLAGRTAAAQLPDFLSPPLNTEIVGRLPELCSEKGLQPAPRHAQVQRDLADPVAAFSGQRTPIADGDQTLSRLGGGFFGRQRV